MTALSKATRARFTKELYRSLRPILKLRLSDPSKESTPIAFTSADSIPAKTKLAMITEALEQLGWTFAQKLKIGKDIYYLFAKEGFWPIMVIFFPKLMIVRSPAHDNLKDELRALKRDGSIPDSHAGVVEVAKQFASAFPKAKNQGFNEDNIAFQFPYDDAPPLSKVEAVLKRFGFKTSSTDELSSVAFVNEDALVILEVDKKGDGIDSVFFARFELPQHLHASAQLNAAFRLSAAPL